MNNFIPPRRPRFQGSAITAESGDIGEKITGFFEIINSVTVREPMYVCQYQRTYHKTELKKN